MKRLWLAAMLCLSANSVFGAVILTADRNDIGVGYSVDWASLGGDLTPVVPPATVGAVTLSGSSAFSIFSGSTFNADFLATDMVVSSYDLSTGPVSGVIRLEFANAVFAAGAQVQSLFFGSFGGTIEAFDTANASLGSFNVTGANNGNGDGSAVFAGLVSDMANIKALEFSFGDGAAINMVSVQTRIGDPVVPEPSTWLAMASGLGVLLFARRRR